MDEKRRKIRNKCTQLLLKNKKVSDGYERSWSAHCRMFGELMEPAFADDPATGLNGCIHGNAGAKALMTLKAEEVATVEYWLYLEGCDPNCYNPVQSKDIALQLGFAGDPT